MKKSELKKLIKEEFDVMQSTIDAQPSPFEVSNQTDAGFFIRNTQLGDKFYIPKDAINEIVELIKNAYFV